MVTEVSARVFRRRRLELVCGNSKWAEQGIQDGGAEGDRTPDLMNAISKRAVSLCFALCRLVRRC